VVWLYTPPPARARTAADLGIELGSPPEGEALRIPFWRVPTLAPLGLKARDVMGFTFVVFLVLLPLVLVW
jgi:short subunit fatty acids transporter